MVSAACRARRSPASRNGISAEPSPLAALASSPATRAATSLHGWPSTWRNSRMVGYQGLSSRPKSQRQSDTHGMNSQVGLASAPARCATEESMVMTRSSASIAAAVAAKPTRSESILGDFQIAMLLKLGGARPHLQADERHARHGEHALELIERDRAPQIVDVFGIAGPDQADFEPAQPAKRARHCAASSRRRADRARSPGWFPAWCRTAAAGSAAHIRSRPERLERRGRPAPQSPAGSGA